jgi:predicted RNA-binding Zn ribbon-like protein
MKDLVSRADETLLLELLNTTPAGEAGIEDVLAEDGAGRVWVVPHGGRGTLAELAQLREARDNLQRVLWGHCPANELGRLVSGARWEPVLDNEGLDVRLAVDDEDHRLPARAVLAWGAITRDLPGRLRACTNDECRLFLLDRSHANTARWCSMAVCGNRMKARRHYRRVREAP